MNVMYCLHACLDYAWRSGRIQVMLSRAMVYPH